MEKRVFDQSIVGIFPKEDGNLYYVLALMNSDIINKLIHIINPTANNSSNYIKQLPYKEPSKSDRGFIDKTVKEIMSLDPERDKDKVSYIGCLTRGLKRYMHETTSPLMYVFY